MRVLLALVWFVVMGLGASYAQTTLPLPPKGDKSTEQRVALVIGNSDYRSSPLKNPVNDARAISKRLRELGFVVIERNNLTVKQIGPTLRELRSKLQPGAIAAFFYAGHGVQVKGVNYLPAVDAEISGEEDVSLQSLDVVKILEVFEQAKTRLNLVFLDACRNNPYTRSFRSGGNGLAKVDSPTGTLISFATRPGGVAADGSGKNGLYTEKLLVAMNEPGVPIELALKGVVSAVKSASGGQQEPWMEGSIEGDFFFQPSAAPKAPPKTVTPVATVSSAESSAFELAYWDSVKNSNKPAELQAYLERYPNGVFSGLANARLTELRNKYGNTASVSNRTPMAAAPSQRIAPSSGVDTQSMGTDSADGGSGQLRYWIYNYLHVTNYDSTPAVGQFVLDETVSPVKAWFVGPKDVCHTNLKSVRVERSPSEIVVYPTWGVRGCENVRWVIRVDGSGGHAENNTQFGWVQDSFDRSFKASRQVYPGLTDLMRPQR